jgi:capsular exopolysaccharide synthesis family protein
MEKDLSNNNSADGALVPQSVDLLAPPDRFLATSQLYVRLHRHQLLLRKHWWIVLLVLLVTLLPTWWITRATPRAYHSKARMWLTGKLDLSEGRLYTEELVNFLGTQADLLRSRAVQKRALAAVQTDSNTPPFRPLPRTLDVVRGLVGQPPGAADPEAFPFKLKVTESPKSSILELHATGSEPLSTRAFLNALMSEYLAFKRENRVQASDRAVASLATQVNELAAELKAQQERMYAFQMSNNVVFLQEQGSGAGTYLAALNRQLAGLRTELRLLQLARPEQWVELATKPHVGGGVEQPPPADSSDAAAALAGPEGDLFRANQRIQLLKAKRDELSKSLRPQHPKIIKLNEDIASQEKVVEISRSETLKQLVNRREALQVEISNLEHVFNEWEGKALEASRKMVDYERLRQAVQRTQGAYDKLLSVISTVDLGKSVNQENVSVLEPASAALPVPSLVRNMAIASAMALVLAGGLLWLFGKFDDRFVSPSELAEDVPEKVLGQIMNVPMAKSRTEMRPDVLNSQRFEFLESFRSIRSALWFMDHNGNRPKTILISSSVPREGKSTVALYLAATMALARSRVLLIDADLRRGELHSRFGVENNPGLAQVLNREVQLNEAMVSTSLPNLALLPGGTAEIEPGELIMRSQVGTFLEQVYPRFDYIIIDSPPVLAADDAATLAPNLDGVLFVVRGAFTSARMVHDALQTLRQRRARVLGLIFNRALSSPFEYHPYQRYKKAYQWQAA